MKTSYCAVANPGPISSVHDKCSGKTSFVENFPDILRSMPYQKIPPDLFSLAQRIIGGRVVVISFSEKDKVEPKFSSFRGRKATRSTILATILGELVHEHIRDQSTLLSVMWSSVNQFCRDLLFRDDHVETDPLRPWRETLQQLPSQGDVLILIDEIDGLEDLWHSVFNDEVESGTLVHALWDAVLMLRNKSLQGRFHAVVVGRLPNLFLRARNLSTSSSPSKLRSIFLPPLKEEHLKLAVQTTSIQGPVGIGRKVNLLEVLRYTCHLGDSEDALDEFIHALHRYTGGVPRCVVASLNGILDWCRRLNNLTTIDEALSNAITDQRANDIDPLSSITDEKSKTESADLFLSFALAAQCEIVVPIAGALWFRGKYRKIVDLAALHNVWLDPVPGGDRARVVVPFYSVLTFQKSNESTLRSLANDSRVGLVMQSMQVGNAGTIGDLFEHIIARSVTFGLLRSIFRNVRPSVSQPSPSTSNVTWSEVLGGILCGTRLSSATVPSRFHAGGLSKPIVGFSSHSKYTSARVVTKKNPREWLQQGNKVRPSAENAFEIVFAAIDAYGIIVGEELAVLHPPPQSEAYDFLLLWSIETSIAVQAKCVAQLTAPTIRDEIKKTGKVIPTDGRLVLLIITSGIVISEQSHQLMVFGPGDHKLQRTSFRVPDNMDVVVTSTDELHQRQAISRQDRENIAKLLELKDGRDAQEEDVGHLFDILKGRPLDSK